MSTLLGFLNFSHFKRLRHETLMNDRHLYEDLFKQFYLVNRHFRPTPKEFKQIKLFISLTRFFFYSFCWIDK